MPDVCVRATTISTVPLPSYQSIPSVRLPRVCDMYAVVHVACTSVCVRTCVCIRECVHTCTCVHTTCVYSVPVRPATRSPSTTNTARTIVVSATAVLQGVSHNSGLESCDRVCIKYVCKEKSGREERRRGEEKHFQASPFFFSLSPSLPFKR